MDIVERNCYIAQQLSDWLDRQEEFDLLSNVRLNGVVFALQRRPRPFVRNSTAFETAVNST
jgi:hypothetical protein